MKDIRDILDITLITYNRAPYLEKTLAAVLADESPIRNCELTILDNHSTDETPQVVAAFCAKHPNVKHIVNRFNIGGNPNIARALERYEKPYHWVLCDDDKYDWTGWPGVEAAMDAGEKIICVGDRYLAPTGPKRHDPAELMQQMTFLPSIIYGPGTITSTVLRNAYDNIFALFPHLAPVVAHINHGGAIHVIEHGLVQPGLYGNDGSYTRGDEKTEVFLKSRTMTMAAGFANLTANINDRRLSKRAFRALVLGPQMGLLGFLGQQFFHLRGRAGAASFKDIWHQSSIWLKMLLLPLRFIQNSPLYHLFASQWLYKKAQHIVDKINGRSHKALKDGSDQ